MVLNLSLLSIKLKIWYFAQPPVLVSLMALTCILFHSIEDISVVIYLFLPPQYVVKTNHHPPIRNTCFKIANL